MSVQELSREGIIGFGGAKTSPSVALPPTPTLRKLLGGKGAGLVEMAQLDVPVPPGFVIPTAESIAFFSRGELGDALWRSVEQSLVWLERSTGKRLGDSEAPLLVSVRSGAPVSMPGMMDTILNLGLNDATTAALAKLTGDARFAWDCYRRFIAQYAKVALGCSEATQQAFEDEWQRAKEASRAEFDYQVTAAQLEKVVARYQQVVADATGHPFPQDVRQQLQGAIAAVFRSWNSPRAIVYRQLHSIDPAMGTAVIVQSMVFGNLDAQSGTGVVFSRHPTTGERTLFGEFLRQAQGEDVVAGVRTPQPISALSELSPAAHEGLAAWCHKLEAYFGDMQDIEFTVERGTLYLLQTRAGKRTGRAMVRIAVEMVKEGTLSPEQAILSLAPEKLEELFFPAVQREHAPAALCRGLPASPGAVVGKLVFSAEDAQVAAKKGDAVILVRTDTSPEDIHGMKAAQGIVTSRGGMTSHAAVVARGMGKCCVTGCSALKIHAASKTAVVGTTTLREGDVVTVDGTTGELYVGAMALSPAKVTPELETLMEWVDKTRAMVVRTNADTPADARTARKYGAEGIGLCRTEHMFFAPERILVVRKMILAATAEPRSAALAELRPMQREDFVQLFEVMAGLPVTIRLLDPPLHEFLPRADAEIAELAAALGVAEQVIRTRLEGLTEVNPMLGHRGCRLAISYPEIYEMQVAAIAEAMVEASRRGHRVVAEVMVPLVASASELAWLKPRLTKVMDEVLAAATSSLTYSVGTMIELPRACIVADEIAEFAEFFSFGTNDLTQTTWGISRDDGNHFLPDYLEREILGEDPFVSLDASGVGALVELACSKGRAKRPDLKLGICGEHGGEVRSIMFFHRLGLDYVSCSPFRVPIARAAAAKAALLYPRQPAARS